MSMKKTTQRRFELNEVKKKSVAGGKGECVKKSFGQGYYGKKKKYMIFDICFVLHF